MKATQQVPTAQTKDTGPTSDSDEYGLIWGYHFVPNQPPRSITSEEAVEFLAAAPGIADEFIWLHFSLSHSASEPWLRQYLNLPDTFYECLRSDVDSTHLVQDGDSLVAHIHDVLLDFTFDASTVATTTLCIKPRVLVSARRRPFRSVDELKQAVERGQVFRSPIELLSHLLREQARVLFEIVRRSTTRMDPMEDRLLGKRISVSRSELGSLRRMLVRLQRVLAPEPAAFFRLLTRPPAWMTEEELQNLQQAAERFSTAISDTAALVERVKQLQEELAALVDAQTNRTLFILTLVTVLALPINLVAGLFGMNVGGIPLSQHPYGFFLVLGPLLVLTAFLTYWGWIKGRD